MCLNIEFLSKCGLCPVPKNNKNFIPQTRHICTLTIIPEAPPAESTPETFTPATFTPATFTPATFTPVNSPPAASDPSASTQAATEPADSHPERTIKIATRIPCKGTCTPEQIKQHAASLAAHVAEVQTRYLDPRQAKLPVDAGKELMKLGDMLRIYREETRRYEEAAEGMEKIEGGPSWVNGQFKGLVKTLDALKRQWSVYGQAAAQVDEWVGGDFREVEMVWLKDPVPRGGRE